MIYEMIYYGQPIQELSNGAIAKPILLFPKKWHVYNDVKSMTSEVKKKKP